LHVSHADTDVSNLKTKNEFCLKAMSTKSQVFTSFYSKGFGLKFAERNQSPGELSIRRHQCLGSNSEEGIWCSCKTWERHYIEDKRRMQKRDPHC